KTEIQLVEGPRNHRGYVILLFAAAAESLDCPNNCLEKRFHRKVRTTLQGVQQKGLAKLFPSRVRGFGDSVRVECERVAGSKLYFRNLAMPGIKQSHYGAGRTEPLHLGRLRDVTLRALTGAQQEWRKVST